MPQAYINRIGTAVPRHEVHDYFLRFAGANLAGSPRERAAFTKMASRSGIERRYSCISPAADPEGASVDTDGFFPRGAFPGTGARMDFYDRHAGDLAMDAIARLELGDAPGITHLVVASCTGMSAPGLDLEIVHRAGLSPSVERTLIGFMGCYAAMNALKQARHIVRSDPQARVLVVNCELCTLHLKETRDLERLLTFSLWGDGASAALVTSDPHGLALDGFKALLAPHGRDLMTWNVRDDGFDMVLSGAVPGAIRELLGERKDEVLDGAAQDDVSLWAVHPGGRSVLDAVEKVLGLGPEDLAQSREVLRTCGNMSSATVMFVLEKMLQTATDGERGLGMAFGPGLTAETMTFRKVA